MLERTIEADRLYVMDRGYAKFALFNRIVAAQSSYVCRLRDNSVYQVEEKRELTAEGRASGVLSDQVVKIGNWGTADIRPSHKIRLVCVRGIQTCIFRARVEESRHAQYCSAQHLLAVDDEFPRAFSVNSARDLRPDSRHGLKRSGWQVESCRTKRSRPGNSVASENVNCSARCNVGGNP